MEKGFKNEREAQRHSYLVIQNLQIQMISD
jgi:hypothetical protein